MKISFVEAHDTGTPVGDPIECESIRRVFWGPQRSDKLYFGSVKANIGHTGATSDVAALIKAALMIQKGLVPMQADFTKFNPKIPFLLPDNMEISATTQSLGGSICLNNYGTASSIAAMIICRPPANPSKIQSYVSSQIRKPPRKYPIRLSANSPGSLRAYCAALRRLLNTRTTTASSETNVANLAYNLAHRTNFSLATFIGYDSKLHVRAQQ